MASRHVLRRAINIADLSMPSLVEVARKVVGVERLIVTHLRETGCMTDGDSIEV